MAGAYPRYTVTELETIAAAIFERRLPQGVSIPIDIDLLVDTEPNASLDVAKGLRQKSGVAGCVMAHPEERLFTIVIDEDVLDGNAAFYRFTVAEELAHLILHRGVLEQVQNLDDVVTLHSSVDYDGMDRNAKRLASCLLMPTPQLRQDARELFKVLRPSCPSVSNLCQTLTTRLSQRYNVSTTAMRIRLLNWPLSIYAAIQGALNEGLDELPG